MCSILSRPLVPLACALSAGAALGAFCRANSVIIAAASLAALFAAAAFRARRLRAATLLLACLAAFCFGSARASLAAARALAVSVPVGEKRPLLCEGRVSGRPRPRQWGMSFDLELAACSDGGGESSPAHGGVRVNARHAPAGLAEGDSVRALLVFKPPRTFRNRGSFDYGAYLMSRRIGAVAGAAGPVFKIGQGSRGPMERLLQGARSRIRASIDSRLSGDERALALALALGDRAEIGPQLRAAFSDAGIAHLLALSGLHVGYVALFIYLLVRATLGLVPGLVARVPVRRLAAGVTIPALWLYVALTGGAISAVRAAVMLSAYLAGLLLGRKSDLFSALALAVILILVAAPLSVISVSFQLSVAAVFGIALIAAPLAGRAGSGGGILVRAGRWAAALAAVSFAAVAATAPIIAYHFKSFTAAGIAVNMLAVPLTGLILQPLVLAAQCAAVLWPAAAQWLWSAAALPAGALVSIAHAASKFGAPLVFRWAPSAPEAAAVAAAVSAAALSFRMALPYRRVLVSSLALIMLTGAVCQRAMPALDTRLHVTFFDVGQGESALVRFPGGSNLLIDGGGIKGSSMDVGREVLGPALLAMGVRRIDRVLLTHPHFDHYDGLREIVRSFSPELVWVNGLPAPEPEREQWEAFVAAAAEAGVPLVEVPEEGVRMDIGGARLRIMPRLQGAPLDFNDTSLAAVVAYGRRRFLFTGDLTERGERLLMDSGAMLEADLLKVGHHGSRDASSSEFLAAVSPEVAVISAGLGNRYNFPHAEAVRRIEGSGARVMCTGTHGAVTVSTDGSDLAVKSFVE